MLHRRRASTGILCLVAAATTGCSSGTSDTSALSPSISLPSLPTLASSAPSPPPATETPVGSATQIYSRVAQGAVGCWFGTKGPLKKDYIYHAEADAPSRGARAEIVVHVRDLTQPNPRGAKAYRVRIDPTSETAATVATENLKMPQEMADAMTLDVNRWSKGDQGCSGISTAAGWGAPNVAAGEKPATAAPATAKKIKKKTAAR